MKECGPCLVFASFTLAFALYLRKKHGKPSVRVRKTSARVRKTSVRVRKTSVRVQNTYYQNTHTHPHTHTHPNITKQYKTTTVQIKTNTVQIKTNTADSHKSCKILMPKEPGQRCP